MTAIQLGVLMDPIESIHYKKDSTLSMLFAAEERGWDIHYFEQKDIFLREGTVFAKTRLLKVFHDPNQWYEFGFEQIIPLSNLNIILMRKDPPFDIEYIYTTYLLEQAERAGVLVVNRPQSLRDANEKMFTTWFPECCPPTLVTRSIDLLREFYLTHQDIVCKPLEGMGGSSVFRLHYPEQNASVVFEVLTHQGTKYAMAQQYIPEITSGDKRIILINGEPVPYALARVPAAGELRGNLAAGAKGIAQPLSERDLWIAKQVGPKLREKGLYFVGLDVIGDYLTEINVTSPTGIREIEEQCGINIADTFLKSLEQLL
jgi:glutathione synthase